MTTAPTGTVFMVMTLKNMQYTDVDGAAGNGSVTRNSSSSDLNLPPGTNTIKLARLYWGGRVKNSDFDLKSDANKKIKIRKELPVCILMLQL